MATLDNASWHTNSDEFPDDLPEEHAATHIGMFIAWLLLNQFESDWFRSELPTELESVRSKEITGRELILEYCDGKFFSEMVSPEILGFVEKYYSQNSGYFKDYRALLVQGLASDYHVLDTWENFTKISEKISSRYQVWLKKSSRQWWQFWKK